METQVGIIGAGPAGLVLSHLLDGAVIDSVRARGQEGPEAYVEARNPGRGPQELRHRRGLLDQLEILADRLQREGLVHHGVNLQFDGDRHRIDFAALTGKSITVVRPAGDGKGPHRGAPGAWPPLALRGGGVGHLRPGGRRRRSSPGRRRRSRADPAAAPSLGRHGR